MSSPTLNNPLPLNSSVSTTGTSSQAAREEAQVRKVAAEFEAMLLAQITKSLNPLNSDDEESVLSGGANEMYGNMFGEQLAQSMAKNGGVGLADMLVEKMLHKKSVTAKNTATEAAPAAEASPVQRAMTAARSLRDDEPTVTTSLRVSDSPFNTLSSTATESNSLPLNTSNPNHISQLTRPRRVFPIQPSEVTPTQTTSSSSGASIISTSAWEPVTLNMPVQGRITSEFGMRHHPTLGGHRHHKGVDIAAPRGTPIEAAASGTVVFAGRQGAYGKTVVIEHADGRRTRYAHAEEINVRAGDTVASGEQIATVGSTGRSTGPHLHFEVLEQGHHIDPLQALANAPTLARR